MGRPKAKAAKPRVGRARTRVLIVDDHPVLRRGLRELIEDEPDLTVCGEAGTGVEALEVCRDTRPDLVILDIALRESDGIELIPRLRALDPALRVIVISMHEETLYVERAMRAGAVGYVMKLDASSSIVDAIRAVLAGATYVSARAGAPDTPGAARAPDRGAIERLSDRELEVFTLIGQGLTTRQIAQKLDLSVKTVETHRENLKAKLNLPSGNELMRVAAQWFLRKD